MKVVEGVIIYFIFKQFKQVNFDNIILKLNQLKYLSYVRYIKEWEVYFQDTAFNHKRILVL